MLKDRSFQEWKERLNSAYFYSSKEIQEILEAFNEAIFRLEQMEDKAEGLDY